MTAARSIAQALPGVGPRGGGLESAGVGTKRWVAAAALVAQALLVAAIYWPTRGLSFTSDDWVYLAALRQGLWAAVGTPIGYHWQPLACLWVAAIRSAVGESPALFQAINLVQLALLGQLTFQLGRRLLADTMAAFLASLMVVGSAAFYEATYWPLAGNMHLLAALFYILAVILAYDWASGRLPRSGGWLLGLSLASAVLSHPAMVASLAACALTLLVVRPSRDPGPRESSLAARLAPLLPVAGAAVVFLLMRLRPNPMAGQAPPPGLDPVRALFLVRTGLISVGTGRASEEFLDRVLALGTPVRHPSPQIWVFVGAWLTVAAIAAVLLLRGARPNGVRLLVAFLGLHLAALTIGGGMSARQTAVPSVFAALITAWALGAAARGLAARAKDTTVSAIFWASPVACVLLWIAAAQTDHRTAAAIHLRVAGALRLTVAKLKEVVPEGARTEVTMINMPAVMAAGGLHAFAFTNGLVELAHLSTSASTAVSWAFIPVRGAPPHVIPGMPLFSRNELRRQLSDPRRVLLLYEDDPPSLRRLTLADMDTLVGQ